LKAGPTPPSEPLPTGIHNAYWFQAFNAVSWQICVGNPLILFARELGSTATTIGLLVSLAPLLSIIQLPVSRYAEGIGYRRLMMTGWGARVLMLIFLSALPLLGAFLPREALVNLLLAIMFIFHLLRGASMCAWLPWINAIVPESVRGYYLSWDRRFINIASVITLFLSGSILSLSHGAYSFALVFFVSFAGGAASLYFLNRVPSAPQPMKSGVMPEHPGWREVLRDVPFRRLMIFGIAVQVGLAAHGAFGVVFMREEIGLSDGSILWLNAVAAFTGILGLTFLGRHADRIGSKPYLGLSWCWWLVSLFLWFLLSIRALDHPKMVMVGMWVVGGFFGSCYELSLTRLLLNTVGNRQGKTFFFAIYGVSVSVTLSIMPVLWGMILDGLRNTRLSLLGIGLDRYSVLFGVEWLLILVTTALLVRLKEPRSQPASSVIYEVFVGWPARSLSQLLQLFRQGE
jgi:MFS family permease